jgi:hypothetical protein
VNYFLDNTCFLWRLSLFQISKKQNVPVIAGNGMETLPAVRRSDEPVEPVVSY